MTWLILLFHVSVLYQPEMPFYVLHPDTSPKLEFELFSVLNGVFLLFMDAWNMPMFFFLAGVNSYLSLQRYVIPNKYSNKDIDIIKFGPMAKYIQSLIMIRYFSDVILKNTEKNVFIAYLCPQSFYRFVIQYSLQ